MEEKTLKQIFITLIFMLILAFWTKRNADFLEPRTGLHMNYVGAFIVTGFLYPIAFGGNAILEILHDGVDKQYISLEGKTMQNNLREDFEKRMDELGYPILSYGGEYQEDTAYMWIGFQAARTITQSELEKAAEALGKTEPPGYGKLDWNDLMPHMKEEWIRCAKAAFQAIGITISGDV